MAPHLDVTLDPPIRFASALAPPSRSRNCHAGLWLVLAAASCAHGAWADATKLDPLARRAMYQVRQGASLERLKKARISTNAARELDVFIGPGDHTPYRDRGLIVKCIAAPPWIDS